MRTSKVVALVATTALLVVGAAFAALAANTGWVEENGTWKYQKNGEYVCDEWAKSGNDYYYLDENGELGSDRFVEGSNGYLYYCLEDGKMAKNQWIKKDNTDDDQAYDAVIYYYFQNSGKAYKAVDSKTSFKSINGKKYAFDGDGKMLYGWVGKNAEMYNTTDSDDWKNATYYCGDETNGAQTTGWKQITVYDSAQTDVDNTYWFYFGANGARTQGKTSSINGKKYTFNSYGAMLTSWDYATVTGSVNNASPNAVNSSKYYLSQGDMLIKGWKKAVPSEDIDADAYNSDTAYWFYGQGDGTVVANQIKSIKGKKYAFNEKGEMLTGIVFINPIDGAPVDTGLKSGSKYEINTIAEVKQAIADGLYVTYFSATDEDGSMKTGSQTVTIDGDSFKFYFSTKNADKGFGITKKQGNSYYVGGLKIQADDSVAAYQFYKLTNGVIANFTDVVTGVKAGDTYNTTDYALISSTGAIITSGTRKDGNGLVFKYNSTSKAWDVSNEQ